jgi:3-oxoacyl-[acyl-carrier protein] reductase
MAEATSELGGMHIVVANAGIARKVCLENLDDDAWNAVIDVDLHGLGDASARRPHANGRLRRLIATSSVAGTVLCVAGALPLRGKAGLVGLVKSLAVEFGPDGITPTLSRPASLEHGSPSTP